jgi:uncharacterized protein (TIGR01777 family)
MRVVLTGGTGLIGRALSADLVRDREVVVLSRAPERATGLPNGVRVERWDARSAAGWGGLADGADAIVNLAGESISKRWTAERKRRIRESRLDAGRAVVSAVAQASVKPRVVIQASGIGYYGPQCDEVIAEDAPPGEDWMGRVAVEWEASTAPVEALGVRRAVVRSGLVLSAAGGVFPLMALPFRLFVGGRLGSGRQWLPWVHVADQVRAIRFLIESEIASGPFNLVAPQAVTNAEFSRVLARVLSRPSLLAVPAFALRLVLGEMASLVLTGQRAVPQRLEDLGFTFRYPELEPALRDLLGRPVAT